MLIFFIAPAFILLSLLAYARPQTATLLLLALMPTYVIRFLVIGIPTNFFEVSILIVFFVSLTHKQIRRHWHKTLKQVPVWDGSLVLLFIISTVASTIVSPHLNTSLGILKGWVFAPLLVGWMTYAYKQGDGGGKFHAQALRSLILSGLVVSLFGLSQINQLYRVRSIYDVSNSLALFIVPLLVASFYLVANHHKKYLYFFVLIILATTLVATQSISGIIATIASFVIIGGFYLLENKSRHNIKIVAPIILAVTFVILSIYTLSINGRLSYLTQPWLSQGSHNSISVRMQLWSIGAELIKEKPLLGIGLGSFEPAYQQALHSRFSQFHSCMEVNKNCTSPLSEFVYRDPHNWLISFWLNTGFLGLLSFTLINLSVVFMVITTHKAVKHHTKQALLIATTLALVSLLIFGLADTIYWKNDLSALHWVFLALLLPRNTRKKTVL